MHITQESDYAVRIVYCLAKCGTRRDARGISEEMCVTLRFSLKILGKLVSSGIVESYKGNRGGYELARPASEITLKDVIDAVEGPYDLIFVDAAKGQYIHYLPEVMRLLGTDGVLVSDNVLQEGDIIESRFAVERRNRTIHSRMREYLYELKHHDQLQTSIIPLGDGVALSVKRSDIYLKGDVVL